MSIINRALFIAALMLCATAARSDGILNPGKGGASDPTFGFLLGGQKSGGVAGCTNVSLSFTTACNSMYIPVIH